MAGFIAGVIVTAILLFGAMTVYSISQMAGMYDRSIERWFDGDDN